MSDRALLRPRATGDKRLFSKSIPTRPFALILPKSCPSFWFGLPPQKGGRGVGALVATALPVRSWSVGRSAIRDGICLRGAASDQAVRLGEAYRSGGVSVELAAFAARASGVRRACGGACACRMRHRQHARAQRPAPATAFRADVRRDRIKEHGQGVADPGSDLQGRVGARGLEGGPERALCAAQDLSDLPLVRRAWSEDETRRSASSRGLLYHHARPDESKLELLSRDQYRVSQCV